MSDASLQVLPEPTIPVIDIAALESASSTAYESVAREFLEAAQTIGFFYIRNHGVPQALIQDVFSVAQDFFGHTPAEKETVRVSERHRGFLDLGQARMKGSATADLKESFIWGREFTDAELGTLASNPMIGRNQWPAFVPRMPSVLNAYFEACIALGHKLLRVFAVALDVDPDYFTGSFGHTISRGSILYYPPQPANLGDKHFGVAPHTDYGCLTLLYQDGTGGLEVHSKGGSWVKATPIPDTYVVNVGDLLARWTNNRFRSTPHRVINSTGRSRQSIAVFVDPDFSTRIAPVVHPPQTARFPATTCGEYILKRFDTSFGYRQVPS